MKNTKMIWFTVPSWLFQKKDIEKWGSEELMNCVDLNENGLPVTFKESVIEGFIVRETEKAIQVEASCYNYKSSKIWLPKSQIIRQEEK